MARLPKAEPILRAAREWRDRCLIEDGSIFTEERVWHGDNVAELDKYFVQNLDYGEGDFWTKLEAQLKPASEGAKKLAAEILWTMYLMVHVKSMGAETKRYQIRQVWGWSGEDLPEDHQLLGEILAAGISHPGTAYHTHRWRELRFFITMLTDWKALPRPERQQLMNDPWAYAGWLEAREYAKGRQLRHILLFLLFPEQFEPITTGSHKRKVVKAFREKWGQADTDFDYSDQTALDRQVLQVRERLAAELHSDSQIINFYSPTLASEWREGKATPSKPATVTDWPEKDAAEAWLQKELGPQRVWLIGTGGGGRLWPDFKEEGLVAVDFPYLTDLTEYASREEVQAIISEQEGRENPTNDSLAAWQFARDIQVGDVVIAKQGRGRLFGWGRVTGEYTYEPERSEYRHTRTVEWKAIGEWGLEGDQRAIATKTLTEFRQYPQWTCWALRRMGSGQTDSPEPKPDGTYSHQQALDGLFLYPEEFTTILDSLGRRKNVILQGPPGVGKSFIARRLAYALIGQKAPERVQVVQFHQSYSYEDFVQGWRPNERGGFVLRDGIFHRFCRRAADDPSGQPYVFVIDEINRGNLSRIFGELLMLIESDKRGRDHAIPLTYSPDDAFFVPENVHVVGLMNTADRSLALVDYALRRRFVFIDLEPAFGRERFSEYLLEQGMHSEIVSRIHSRMAALNSAIRADRKNLGPGYEIGHSYFVPSGEAENLDDTWYASVISTEIAPLLREYWFDQPNRVDEHLARLTE
jgi:hypothetical protein